MQEQQSKFTMSFFGMLILVLTLVGLAVYGVNRYTAQSDADVMMAENDGKMMEETSPAADDTMMESDTSMKSDDTTTQDSVMAESNGYVAYSESAYQQAEGKQRVLFFHASWCPTCKIANAELLERLEEIPDDIVIFKVDYDTASELKNKYGVTYQHTFVVVDAEGEAVTKWNGGTLNTILERVQ